MNRPSLTDLLPLALVIIAVPAVSGAAYHLYSPIGNTNTYLLDDQDQVAHTWTSAFAPALSVQLLPSGRILRTGIAGNAVFTNGGGGGIIEQVDSANTVTWRYDYSTSTHCQHHDIEPMPNGNVLLIAWELKTTADCVAAGRNPSTVTSSGLWPDHVVEVQPTSPTSGVVVWEWHAWDHLVQEFNASKANYGVVADHPELINLNRTAAARPSEADWTHLNSVRYNAELDQILVSCHTFSEIWVIDHGTTTAEAASHAGGVRGHGGDLLYRWGNPAAYNRGVAADQKLFGQHDARWIPAGYPGAGHITIFNNGLGRPAGAFSSIEEIAPPVDAGGNYSSPGTAAWGPTTTAWHYQAATPTTFYSANIGGAHRAPSGNTVICEGTTAEFFEVTPAGETVWSYGYHGQVFRVSRIEDDDPAISHLFPATEWLVW